MEPATANHQCDSVHSVGSDTGVWSISCEVEVLRLAHQRTIAALGMTDYIRMLRGERRMVAIELYEKVFCEKFVVGGEGEVGDPVCEAALRRHLAEAHPQHPPRLESSLQPALHARPSEVEYAPIMPLLTPESSSITLCAVSQRASGVAQMMMSDGAGHGGVTGESAVGESSLYHCSLRSSDGRPGDASPSLRWIDLREDRGAVVNGVVQTSESDLERYSAHNDTDGGDGALMPAVGHDASSRSVRVQSQRLTSSFLRDNLNLLRLQPAVGSSHTLWWAVVEAPSPLSSSLSCAAFLLHCDEVADLIKELRLPRDKGKLDGAVVATVASLIRSSGVLLATRVRCMIDILDQLHAAGADLNALVGGFTALHYVASTLTVDESGSTDATLDQVGRLLRPLCAFLRSRGACFDVAGEYTNFSPSTPEDVYHGCPRGWQLSTRSGVVEAPHPRATAMELFVDRAFTSEGWAACISALRTAGEAAPPGLTASEMSAVERGIMNSLWRCSPTFAKVFRRSFAWVRAALQSPSLTFEFAARILNHRDLQFLVPSHPVQPTQRVEVGDVGVFGSALSIVEEYGCDGVYEPLKYSTCEVWGIANKVTIPIPVGVQLHLAGMVTDLERLLVNGMDGGVTAGGCLLGAAALLHACQPGTIDTSKSSYTEERSFFLHRAVHPQVLFASVVHRVSSCMEFLMKSGTRPSPVLNGLTALHIIASVGYDRHEPLHDDNSSLREATGRILDLWLSPIVRMLALSGDDGEHAVVCDRAFCRVVQGCQRCGDRNQLSRVQHCDGVTARRILAQRGWKCCLAALDMYKHRHDKVVPPPLPYSAEELIGVELQLAGELATMEGADQWHRWRNALAQYPTMKLRSSLPVVLSRWRESIFVEDFEVLRGREVDWTYHWGPGIYFQEGYPCSDLVPCTALLSVCIQFPPPYLRGLLTLPSTRPSKDQLSVTLALLCRRMHHGMGDLPIDIVGVLLEAGADPNHKYVHTTFVEGTGKISATRRSAVEYIVAPPWDEDVTQEERTAKFIPNDEKLAVVLRLLVAGGGRLNEHLGPPDLLFAGMTRCEVHDVRCQSSRSDATAVCGCSGYFSLVGPLASLRARRMVLCLDALGAPRVSIFELTKTLQREEEAARVYGVVSDEKRGRLFIEGRKRSYVKKHRTANIVPMAVVDGVTQGESMDESAAESEWEPCGGCSSLASAPSVSEMVLGE